MNEFMPMLVSTLGWALLHFLWQGLLVGLASAAVLLMMGNARPQARYAVTGVALLLCLLLPLLTVAQGLRAPSGAPVAEATADVIAAQAAAPQPIARALALAPGWRDALRPHLPLLVALWSLGAAALALRMALGLAWVAQAGADGHGRGDVHWQARLDALARRMALPRRVLLRVVDELDGPVAARIWRPVVLVPAALVARMPPDWLEALLAHELAHVRRHDYLVNLMQSAVEALLFYHPVVWWLSRRMRIERELIADDLAASTLGEPRRLALALDYLAQSRAPTPHLALAAHGGHLMSRIQRLVRPRQQSLSWKIALPILGLSAACLSAFAQSGAPLAIATTVASESAISVHREGGVDYAVLGASDEDSIKFSGNHDDLADVRTLRGRFGNDLVWFRREGQAYVIQDPALVARARAAWQPTEPVGAKMEALGKQMEAHGERMEAIGQRMEAASGKSGPTQARMEAMSERMSALAERMDPIAAKMETASRGELEALTAQAGEITAQMESLGAEMEKLGEQLERDYAPLTGMGREMEIAGQPMQALGDEMGELGKQMEKLSEAANRETIAIIDQGVRDGKAVRVEQAARQ